MNPALLKLAKQVMADNGYKKPRRIGNSQFSAVFVCWKGRTPYRLEVWTTTGLIGVDVYKRIKEIRYMTPLGE